MIDILHTALISENRTTIFAGTPSVSSNTEWKTWQKPAGITIVQIRLIGAGGGGGGCTGGVGGRGGDGFVLAFWW